MNAPGVTAFGIQWGRNHAYPKNTGAVFEDEKHPRYLLRMRSYYTRTDPLWWNCIVTNKVGGKKAVRSWLNNRARVAITGALQKKGYAKDGSRLKTDDSASMPIGDLVGSAQFQCRETLLHTSWKDVCQQADVAIASLERALHGGKMARSAKAFKKDTREPEKSNTPTKEKSFKVSFVRLP